MEIGEERERLQGTDKDVKRGIGKGDWRGGRKGIGRERKGAEGRRWRWG